MLVYLNGEYLDHDRAAVSVDDRGFLFGDGVYEVTRARNGRLFEPGRHLRRLGRGLEVLGIAPPAGVEPEGAGLAEISDRLLRDRGRVSGDAILTEGASTNLFAVIGAALRTHPATQRILPGITREVILELANEQGLSVVEQPVAVADLSRVTELFLTSTSNDVMPVARLDGRVVGSGRPGPVARQLQAALRERLERDTARAPTV